MLNHILLWTSVFVLLLSGCTTYNPPKECGPDGCPIGVENEN